jgi:hypothetical protein
MQSAKRRGRTPEEIIASQSEQARKLKEAKAATASVPATMTPATPATTTIDTRTPAEIYADEICQTAIVGQLVKFDGKVGKFVIVETEEEISNREFIVAVDETLAGFIRFNGDGQLPDRVQGQPYKGWRKPKRETLGDNDPAQWPIGPLSGKAEDPWKEQANLVLVDPTTRAFFTFATTSKTGLSGVGALLQHYNRMLKHDADSYPIVELAPSGYEDKRYGWVNKPVFAIIGRTPKNSTVTPATDVAADMNDELPASLRA